MNSRRQEIPRAVLSEHFDERLRDRRVVAAVFFTFQFEPAFFEQEILPVFLDTSLSHVPKIRLLQLEEALQPLADKVAVYYDAGALVLGTGAPSLNVKRIPVRQKHGVFHPKNVFLLVEELATNTDVGSSELPERALLVAAMSANLTRSGWWENVEVAHIEEIRSDDRTLLRDSVDAHLRDARKLAGETLDPQRHAALDDIRRFLRGTSRLQQRSVDGQLRSQFFGGRGSLPEFLADATRGVLEGMRLEVIAPFVEANEADGESAPLRELTDAFGPKEIRVMLPRTRNGAAACPEAMFRWLRSMDGVSWGRLPSDLLALGNGADAQSRFVHAKVYRFFSIQPRREIVFIGSFNLTRAAHEVRGNTESGFLVEVEPSRATGFWLEPEMGEPMTFEPSCDVEEGMAADVPPVELRYDWDTEQATVLWRGIAPSGRLVLQCRGVDFAVLEGMVPDVVTAVTAVEAAKLRELLRESCFVLVHECASSASSASERESFQEREGMILVQETGMARKPSLAMQLTAAEILQYWALLSVEQKAEFLAARAPEALLAGDGMAVESAQLRVVSADSPFDRFAGIFHAFTCFERHVKSSIREEREVEAVARLFAQRYDSLAHLIEQLAGADAKVSSRVSEQTSVVDMTAGDVELFVQILCARQTLDEIEREFPAFASSRRADFASLRARIAAIGVRQRLVVSAADMDSFLDWFEPWFLKRASPATMEAT